LLRPSRRRALQSFGALSLGALLPNSDAVTPADDARCAPAGAAARLHIPGAEGYLGRIAPRGAPLVLVAIRRPRLPDGAAQGPLAYYLRHAGRTYLNPTLLLASGERVRIALANELDEPTIAHWHGLAVDTRNDGNGMVLVAPRDRYTYDFEVRDRGALYWYHPHPHGSTARQTADGLFGLIDVDDADHARLRRALDLVPGRTELTLVLQDRPRDGRYRPSEADLVHGFMGDDACVNGTRCAYVDVASRLYRLRLLNACNARTLRLAFTTAAGARVPFVVVGNDGGLLPAPVTAQEAFFATAERLDVLLDLRDAPVGETIVLRSLEFDPMHGEMPAAPASDATADHATGHGADTSPRGADPARVPAWPEGAPRPLLEFRVRERVRYERRVPAALAAHVPVDTADARERPLRLGYNKGRWRINDKVFAMGETPIDVARETTEVWLLRNYHTSMPHAMHLHGFHFDVLERETSPDAVRALAHDDKGRLASDLGRKDTVLVWPGESVRIAIRFALPWPAPQTYVFHCHNLEHEDGGMMLGVRVA